MKFKVRDGFVVRIQTRIDMPDGRIEVQETTFYGGQPVELDAAGAEQHVHKLEPADKAASAWLDSKAEPLTKAASDADLQALIDRAVAVALATQTRAAVPA